MIKRLDRKATLVRLDAGQPSNVSAPARPLYDHASLGGDLDDGFVTVGAAGQTAGCPRLALAS